MANNSSKYYPLVGFHFKVEFSGLGSSDVDCRFQAVSGLSMEYETESRKEGGENRFEHLLPVRTKYATLVLKRGLIKDSALKNWILESLFALSENVKDKNKPLIQPKDLTVSLLDENHNSLITWNVVRAWPKKWSVTDFNAEQSQIVIESLEFQYQSFSVK